MTTSFMSGDIFASSSIKTFAHGCNCVGIMGKGVAVEFRSRWPEMYDEYRKLCAARKFILGDVFEWRDKDFTIFNLATQPHWRSRASLSAIKTSLEKMLLRAEQLSISPIALPLIGCGLGQLPPEEVKKIMIEVGSTSAVHFLVADPFKQGVPLS